MVLLSPKQNCTGCGVCVSVCNHNAIIFNKDIYGFEYPEINLQKCVGCRMCQKKCPQLNEVQFGKSQKVIASYRIDKKEHLASSSGGVGTIVAQKFINEGGVVYGCSFISPFSLKHIRCTTKEDIIKLRGSKYAQSDLVHILPLIKQDVKLGKKILFIGTPCQVAAIKSLYLKTESVYTIDILCHGVPSMQFLADTLPKDLLMCRKKDLQFRVESKYRFKISFEDGKNYERSLSNDIFMKGFFNGISNRLSCYNCTYATHNRVSDLTIGDFWGLKSTLLTEVEKGVSLSLINNEKGAYLMDLCKEELFSEQRPISEAIIGNKPLNHPTSKNIRVDIFRFLYPKLGYKLSQWFSLPDKMVAMKIKNLLQKD